MKKKTVKILALILALVSVFFTYGCAEVDAGEALAAYKELYAEAYEIAKIVYGEGLPYDGEYDLEQISGDKYVPVSDSSPYKSQKELKDAVLAVYSEAFYESTLSLVLFDGAEADENGLMGVSPRYKEKNGVLYTNIKYEAFVVLAPRDNEGAKISETSRTGAVVTAPYTLNGEQKTKKTVIVKTENGWRFDGLV